MTSQLSVANPIVPVEDNLWNNVRRSRLSLHLNTPRMRRWLLVQLVSMPVDDTADTQQVAPAHLPQAHTESPKNYRTLVNDYWTTQLLHRSN